MNHFVNPDSWHTNLRKTRKDRHITQQELAKRAGIRQSRISQIENGRVDPKLSEMVEISQILGLILVQIPDHVVPIVEDAMRENARRRRTGRSLTIPELILGDRAYG